MLSGGSTTTALHAPSGLSGIERTVWYGTLDGKPGMTERRKCGFIPLVPGSASGWWG